MQQALGTVHSLFVQDKECVQSKLVINLDEESFGLFVGC